MNPLNFNREKVMFEYNINRLEENSIDFVYAFDCNDSKEDSILRPEMTIKSSSSDWFVYTYVVKPSKAKSK